MRLITVSLLLLLDYFVVGQYWEPLSTLPAAGRDDAVSFSIDGYGYVVTGNQNGFSESNRMFKYSPTTNLWEESQIFPGESRQYSGSFVLNGRAYVIGGYSSSNQALKDVWKFDPKFNTWTQLNDFPGEARWSFFTFSTEEFGFIGTGATIGGPTVSDCWKYFPEIDSWQQISSYPEGAIREVHGLSINNECFAGTGMKLNPLTFSNKFYHYDVLLDNWSPIDDFPGDSRAYVGMINAGKYGIVGGGWGEQNQFYKDFYLLNLNKEWVELPPFSMQGWRGMTAFSIGNTAYFATGLYENLSRTSDLYRLSFSSEEVFIFPNPSDETSSLFSSFFAEVEIFDAMGKKVDQFEISEGSFYPLPKQASGVYFIQLSQAQIKKGIKWVVR